MAFILTLIYYFRWSGIDDGRHPPSALARLIMTDDHYRDAQDRLLRCDVLVIDEISMLSAKLLTTLDVVLRQVRSSNVAFGGIQIIVSGDFYQLQPVPNALYDDPGEFAFTADIWKSALQHKVILAHVIRQSEVDLIQAVNEVARGCPSESTVQLLYRMKRQLPPSSLRPVYLFALNSQVDVHNADCMDQVIIKLLCYHI